MLNTINFKDGKVTYNEFNIDFKIPLSEQIFSLKEDLLQVEYKDGDYVLDVGWYPELSPKGSFRVFVVYKYDWDNLVFSKKCKSQSSLIKAIKDAVLFIENR